MSLIFLYIPAKHQSTSGFLIFSTGVDLRQEMAKMSKQSYEDL